MEPNLEKSVYQYRYDLFIGLSRVNQGVVMGYENGAIWANL